jgi:hypothetical protein
MSMPYATHVPHISKKLFCATAFACVTRREASFETNRALLACLDKGGMASDLTLAYHGEADKEKKFPFAD